MRVLVARAGKHSRREYTVGAPLRVVTVTAGGARRIWPRTRPCRASRGGTVCRDMWGGVLPGSLSAPIGSSCRGCVGWVVSWQRGLLRLTLG